MKKYIPIFLSFFMVALLNLILWSPSCPVLLPLGSTTISSIYSGSMGVFVPFLVFTVMLFSYLHEIWMNNAFSSNRPSSYAVGQSQMENNSGGGNSGAMMMSSNSKNGMVVVPIDENSGNSGNNSSINYAPRQWASSAGSSSSISRSQASSESWYPRSAVNYD